jgi:hypothetical protein
MASVRARAGRFSLELGPALGVRIPAPHGSSNRADYLLSQLKHSLSGGRFSAEEAAEKLGVSSRTALRLLNEAERVGEIDRVRTGRLIRYGFRPR